ncbi:Hyaluronidase-3 [Merluccius polli]|uniref:Hyaluronidase n=1 Tax=Merluccius polli TaxID=89951 RepID=A0AA47PAQ4_MERPO|nr:Hyaluronidase-3 [Merluccius polli]
MELSPLCLLPMLLHLHLLLLLLLVSPPPCSSAQPTPHPPPPPPAPPLPPEASSPLVEGRPFVVVWNMPTDRCQWLHGVQLHLGAFDIVVNTQQHFLGQNMTIFYRDRLGAYPFISRSGMDVNGGVPQNADLTAHLALADRQISSQLRPDFAGLAVIDWEEWRPLWERNYGWQDEYRLRSKRQVREERWELDSEQEVAEEARRRFEEGARRLMGETLTLGVMSRPGGRWGFYGFPACYNEPKKKKRGGPEGPQYTGQCHPGTSRLNDRLDWLWGASTGLYPSIYLKRRLAGAPEAALMVRHRVLEALRVGSSGRHGNASTQATPVFPYARLAFRRTLDFLNETDLEHTIGEAAALGAAGVVLWGELEFASSKEQCVLLRDYLRHTLGRYVRKLRKYTRRCSHRRCHGNGRCARRHPDVGHVIPNNSTGGGGGRGPFSRHFLCHCYRGWAGERCAESRE